LYASLCKPRFSSACLIDLTMRSYPRRLGISSRLRPPMIFPESGIIFFGLCANGASSLWEDSGPSLPCPYSNSGIAFPCRPFDSSAVVAFPVQLGQPPDEAYLILLKPTYDGTPGSWVLSFPRPGSVPRFSCRARAFYLMLPL